MKSYEDRRLIAEAYESGRTSKDVGEEFSVDPTSVLRYARQFGITVRDRVDGISRRKTSATRRRELTTREGYVLEYLDPEDPFISMGFRNDRSTGKYVLQHRIVMARFLGRTLEPHETVHHINGLRSDNRIENLQLRLGKHGKGVHYTCLDCGSHNIQATEI